ncbi:hypothetical protein NDU88_004039 [Pleurodeles waltl]|uniref:Uncharacterized protein n=1 Tax=Pleurodeles waltl TaxID=8319 RepID=A0AAV7L0R3_PLEWA|nr:hypothetical protein NDU88_004039 [Pleurodeles waltl]
MGARRTVLREHLQVEDCLGSQDEAAADNKIHAPKLQEARPECAELLERLCIVDLGAYTQKTHIEADKSGYWPN